MHTVSDTSAAGTTVSLLYTIDESNGVNAHNVHVNFIVEPQDADANAHGAWVLWCIPDGASNQPPANLTSLEGELANQFIWAAGVWAASNQTPFVLGDTTFGTTRNCANGARLILAVSIDGLTAGLARVASMLTCNTKSL